MCHRPREGYQPVILIGRAGRPEEIGNTVAWLLSDASFVTGGAIPVDARLTGQ